MQVFTKKERPCTVPVDYTAEESNGACSLAYGDFPVRLSGGSYVQLASLMRVWQQIPGAEVDHTMPFRLEGGIFTLSPDFVQRGVHRALRGERFDFSRSPLKLQKWNHVKQAWEPLSIDCVLMTAAFLVHRNRTPGGVFQDRNHTRQRISFRAVEVMENEIKRTLITPVLTGEGDDEALRLELSDEITAMLANLRFSVPAVMATAADDFSCSICLGGGETLGDGERVFTTGCRTGHSFHKRCIDQWFATGRTSCPVCRKAIRHA
jgi:hypothetical protein